jgi:dienelactone hydrolase
MKIVILLLGLVAFSLSFAAAQETNVKSKLVEYSAGPTNMEGYVAYDAKKGPQPGILIVHDWMGLGQFTRDKANELARQGYVAFAVDVYGKGVRPKNRDEAAKMATQLKQDSKELRARIRAAFDKLAAMPEVDAKKIVVMGYCFGGTTALELARSSAPVVGTVSFHVGLSTPASADRGSIKGRVLVLHGADDPFVRPAEVQAFKDEMQKANVRWAMESYGNAVHSFTNPAAGNDNSKGAAYNAEADQQSWKAFQKFLSEVF